MLSPITADTPSGRSRRSKARKESKHYQESDILESPQVYCRSTPGDKISDYEDLWSPAQAASSPMGRGGPLLSSFRPESTGQRRPDVLVDTRKFITYS